MRLAHVSDLHLFPSGDETLGNGPTPLAVAEAIARDLSSISEVLDLVVVSGDLTDTAETAAFAAFERMFAKIDLPVMVVPGNHDGPAGMHDYRNASKAFADWDITNRVKEVAGVRFLGLDTCVEQETEGALDDAGLALVEQEVQREAGSRLVIVMHHPPLVLGLAQFDGFCRLKGREKLLDILNAAPERTVVLSGHVHRSYTAQEGQVACFVAGSLVAPYDSALPFGNTPIRPTEPQDFYYVHDIGTDGRHVVTPQRIRAFAS